MRTRIGLQACDPQQAEEEIKEDKTRANDTSSKQTAQLVHSIEGASAQSDRDFWNRTPFD